MHTNWTKVLSKGSTKIAIFKGLVEDFKFLKALGNFGCHKMCSASKFVLETLRLYTSWTEFIMLT